MAGVLAITGASTGIGAATARHAVKDGWRVVLGARSTDKLEALAEELGGEDKTLAMRCDVTSWDDQQAFVAGRPARFGRPDRPAALARFGALDAFLANAGFGGKRGFLEESPERWKAMIDTNVYGVALSIRAALTPFRGQNRGHMLLMSSMAGRRTLP